jgi:integrase
MIRKVEGKRGRTFEVVWRGTDRPRSLSLKRESDAKRAEGYVRNNRDATKEEILAGIGLRTAPVAAAVKPAGPTIADLYAQLNRSRAAGRNREAADFWLFKSQLSEWHSVRVGSVEVSDIESWIADLKREGYAPATIANAWQLLSRLFKLAEQDRLLTYNPCRFVKAPTIPRRKSITRGDVFTRAEAAAVMSEAPDRFRALFALLLYTGARLGEALALTPSSLHLDGDNPYVMIGARRVVEVDGVIEIEDGTKTGDKDPRIDEPIGLPWVAVVELTAHLERYPVGPDELIFQAPRGGTPSRSSLRQRYWNPTLVAAGVHHVPMIKLRHTAITHGLAAGINPAGMAARVGHSAASTMTLDRYARVLDDQVKDDAAKLDAWYQTERAAIEG